jgi:predicted CXXCH cytochrome family protein
MKYQKLNIKNQNHKSKSKILNFSLSFCILIFAFWIYLFSARHLEFLTTFLWSNIAYAAEECRECHQAIAESLSLTLHADKRCNICHDKTEDHFSTKKGNTFCLHCHQGQEKDVEQRFTVVPTLHDELYCYQCHIVHLPTQGTIEDLDSFKADISVNCTICHIKQLDDLSRSAHGFAGLECSDCHNLHEIKTISRDIEKQIDRCLFCHPTQELEFKYPYTHPLREWQIKCTDCHNPHSDRYEGMLKKYRDKICAECHTDVVIEGGKHPISKGTDHPFNTLKCMNCHRAHGSNFDRLLKHNINNICNTCHD